MGSDMYMNPPQPIYDTETVFDVDGRLPEKLTGRILSLVEQRKQFTLIPTQEGYVLKVHTGRFQ